jgi:membrane protein implicated in regulation of membrane protease activity
MFNKILATASEAFVKFVTTLSHFRVLFLLFLTAFAVTAFFPAATLYAFILAAVIGTAASGYEIYRSINKGRQLIQLQQTEQEQITQIKQLKDELKTLQENTATTVAQANQQARYKAALQKYEFLLQALSDKLKVSSPNQQNKICEELAKLNLQSIAAIANMNDAADITQATLQLEAATSDIKTLIYRHTSEDHIKTYLQNHQEQSALFLEKPELTATINEQAHINKASSKNIDSARVKKSISIGFRAGTTFLGLGLVVTTAIASFILTPAVIVSLPITTVLIASASLLALSAAACTLTSVAHYKYVVPRENLLETLKNTQELKLNEKKITTLQDKINNEKLAQQNYKNVMTTVNKDVQQETARVNRHLNSLALDVKTHQQATQPLDVVNIAHPHLKPQANHSTHQLATTLDDNGNLAHPRFSEGG